MIRALIVSLLLPLCVACASDDPEAASGPRRAIWVTRWDYRTRADVEHLVDRIADAGFDTLLFQVRGNASTFYPSAVEPWAAELGGSDPGYDPLAVALERAHARELEVHAWFNAVPAWWGSRPPTDPRHVVNEHPDWLWYDQAGERQSYSERFYVSLNPCLPEVRAHVATVARELLEKYELDGLHLDYIRFPNEPPAVQPGQDFPRDARTLELYHAATGLAPDDDAFEWDTWRAQQVTELLRAIRVARDATRPEAVLSAAVGAEADSAWSHLQDWPGWVEEGLVDALYPMNYSVDPLRFAARVEHWREWNQHVSVVMGLMVAPLDDEELMRRSKLSLAEFDGFCWFGYLSLWDSRNDVIDVQTSERSAERRARREGLLPLPSDL